MRTLRLIKQPSSSPPPGTLAAAPASQGRPGEVPVRFESLPVPLRAAVRLRPDQTLTIEANLPWLTIGTIVHVVSPEGSEHTAHIHGFDVDINADGSARLRISASVSPEPGRAG